MEILLLMYIIGGLVLAVVSVPMILEKIKPNPFYGFRVPQTLENPELWYKVNKYAGQRLLVAGLLFVLVAVIIYFIPGLSIDAYALACLAVFVVIFAWAIVQSLRYLRSISKSGGA